MRILSSKEFCLIVYSDIKAFTSIQHSNGLRYANLQASSYFSNLLFQITLLFGTKVQLFLYIDINYQIKLCIFAVERQIRV